MIVATTTTTPTPLSIALTNLTEGQTAVTNTTNSANHTLMSHTVKNISTSHSSLASGQLPLAIDTTFIPRISGSTPAGHRPGTSTNVITVGVPFSWKRSVEAGNVVYYR